MKDCLIIVICLFSFSTMAQTNNSFPVQAMIENGIIEGLYDTKSGLQMYFGVPFAKPPIGNLRWKAPEAVDNWKSVLRKTLARARFKQLYSEI